MLPELTLYGETGLQAGLGTACLNSRGGEKGKDALKLTDLTVILIDQALGHTYLIEEVQSHTKDGFSREPDTLKHCSSPAWRQCTQSGRSK